MTRPTEQPAPARLILVRHGTTSWNADYRYNSVTDVELATSALTELQGTALAVRSLRVDRVFSSPQRRARQTAAMLAAHDGRRPVDIALRPGLRELDFGDFEGRTRDELLSGRLAPAFAAWLTGVDGSPEAPGGETWQQASVRAGAVLQEATRLGGTTLLVSHGYLLRILLVGALDLPANVTRRLRWANGGLSELVPGDAGWSLLRHNWLPRDHDRPPPTDQGQESSSSWQMTSSRTSQPSG